MCAKTYLILAMGFPLGTVAFSGGATMARAAEPPLREQVSRFDRNGDGRLSGAERRAMLEALNESQRTPAQSPSAKPPERKAPEHQDRRQERFNHTLG